LEYELVNALKLLLAALLGGIIGLERESLNKSAGFRTHTLVCLGSCLIMITSIEMYTVIGKGIMSDPGRLAAQVVSGIGFLGAGTIMRSGLGIKGLTTAASLWVVAGIGLAVGAGGYLNSIATTAIVMLVLIYMPKIENAYRNKRKRDNTLELIIRDKPGQLGAVSTALGQMNVHIRNVEMKPDEAEKCLIVNFTIDIPYCYTLSDVIETISKVPGVVKVNV